jgi:hypothetical protein
MAFPLTLYMPVKQQFFPQLLLKVVYFFHKLQTKPRADTGIIHYSRLILVPNSESNYRHAGLFTKTKALMLVTSFDGGMIPYFRAFWESKKIRKTFKQLRMIAVDPSPKYTGNASTDYNNFQTWLARQDIPTGGFYSAYPQTMQQIYEKFPEEKRK